MDIAKTLSTNDSNGGKGILHELVQHIPLMCGNMATKANLYIGLMSAKKKLICYLKI
jgi:hypothetical protein